MTTLTSLNYTPVEAPTRKAHKYTKPERQCWRTPNTPAQPVLQLVARSLDGGEIGLDPCADDARTVPAHNHITFAQNCLVANWHYPGAPQGAFINPPFDQPHLYLARAVEMLHRNNIQEAIALLKIGTLSDQKTGALIKAHASAVCCWGAGKAGRMAFVDCDGYAVSGADFDTCSVYFGKSPGRFMQVFDQWGLVAKIQG